MVVVVFAMMVVVAGATASRKGGGVEDLETMTCRVRSRWKKKQIASRNLVSRGRAVDVDKVRTIGE